MNDMEIGKIKNRETDSAMGNHRKVLKLSCISITHNCHIHALKISKHNFYFSYSHFPFYHV